MKILKSMSMICSSSSSSSSSSISISVIITVVSSSNSNGNGNGNGNSNSNSNSNSSNKKGKDYFRRRFVLSSILLSISSLVVVSSPTMEYDELLTLVINCFDGRGSYGGIAHSDFLYEFVHHEKGKQQFQKMYEDEQVLAMYTVALLRSSGKESSTDFDAVNFENTLHSMYLKPCYKDRLMNYLNGTTSVLEYIESSSSSNSTPKHIEREWFDEKALAEESNEKKNKVLAIKSKLLNVLICLVGSDKDAQLDLAKSWGGKKALFITKKKGLLKKYIKQLNTATASTASTTTPRKPVSKHSRTPKKDDGTTAKLFSPSMQSPLGKKQRSIAISPPKSNDRPRTFLERLFSSPAKRNDNNNNDNNNNDADTNNHVIVETVLQDNEEHIETIYNHHDRQLTVDTSFGGNGGCNDDDGEFRIHSTIDDTVVPKRITPTEEEDDYSNWQSPTKKKTISSDYVTAAVAEAVAAATTAPFGTIDDYEINKDSDTLNEEINATTFYPSPKCKSSKKRLEGIRDRQKYPTLINGCRKIEDIYKALEEGFEYLGLLSIWDTILGYETAPILAIPSRNGRPRQYVYVPVSSNQQCLLTNAHNKEWIDHLLKIAGSDKLSEDDVAAGIMVYLIKQHPQALQKLGEILQIPQLMVNNRMDSHTAAAMWNEANTTIRGQRTINRYVYNYYGFRLTPYDEELRKLTDHHVKPIHKKSKVNKQIITWWYKEIDEVVLNLLNNDWTGVDFDAIDIVFGGDHGAGVFAAGVKIILWKGIDIVYSVVEKVAHVDSEKDTYDILNKTCAPKLNSALHRLKDQRLCINKLAIYDDDDNNENNNNSNETFATFVSLFDGDDGNDNDDSDDDDDDDDTNGDTNISYHRLRVLGVGDIKFISMALGKPDMDPHWCVHCDLAKNEFSKLNCSRGIRWTLAGMKQVRENCDNITGNNVPASQIPAIRKGCVKPPLFDAIEPHQWIIPILHVMMGAFNAAFKGFFEYVEQRHESISIKEAELRKIYWKNLNAFEQLTATLDGLKEVEREIKARKKDLIREMKKRTIPTVIQTRGTLFHSLEDRKVMTVELKQINAELQIATNNTSVEKDAVKLLRKQAIDAKEVLDKESSKRGPKGSDIRQRIDQCLKDFGVDRGASHGGDFNGVACLVFEEKIDGIISEIEEILFEYGNGSPYEIETVCDSYRIHFLLLSHIFALSRSSKGEMRDTELKKEIVQQLEEVIPLVDRSTQRLGLSMKTPKRHLVSAHLIDMMIKYDGIAPYLEDWVEQQHQRYKQSTSRCKVRDLVQIANYHSRFDKLFHNTEVMKIKEEMKAKSRRKFKKSSTYFKGDQRNIERKDERRVRRLQAVETAKELFRTKPTLYTGLQMNMNETALC